MEGTRGFPKGISLGEIYTTPTARYPLQGPFIDTSDVEMKLLQDVKLFSSTEEDFLGDNPVFVDSFGMPVLYYKADRSGDYYHADHNGELVGIAYSDPAYEPEGAGEYNLYDNGTYGSDEGLRGFITDDRRARFSSNTSKAGPHKADSFILISAGPDKVYGTVDDIANFNVGPEN